MAIYYIILTIIVFIIAIYCYLTRNFDYWSKLGVNGPKPVIGYGNILFRLSKNVNQIDFQWFKKYGKAFGVYKYNAPVVTITDPELIKRVCVTDFRYFYNRGRDPVMSYSEHPVLCQNVAVSSDNTWKQTRKIFTSLMSSSRMKRMSTKVTDDIQVLMNVLDKQVYNNNNTENGGTGGLRKTMDSFIMYLMIDCFQSQDTGFPSDKPLNKSVGYVMAAVKGSPLLARLRILLPKFVLRLFGISFLVPNGLANSYVNIIDELIGRRLAADEAAGVEQQNDFLEDLLSFMSESKKTEDRQQTDSYLTHDEVVANLYAALIDGYSIITEVIGQAIDELVRDQQSQRRLYDELAKQYALSSSSTNVSDSDQHIITYDMSVKVKYLEAIINESMRLMTNDLRDSRIAAEDYRLADTGITVRRGQLIEFPMYPIHMNPDYFPEPDRFDPDRFMGQNRDKIQPCTFLPFGTGPRACAGQPFSWLIIKLILANLFYRYHFYLDDDDVDDNNHSKHQSIQYKIKHRHLISKN
ncbi:cytochrome P450 3A24-like [Oppia nitens]|uniref:cytochrome P450 3A24-like n=1 Tax=Oppia nitens TaxID=1686743 RepID=UPI0023DBACAB|nr:cytochrome P450 3A24-like [Oppia nitens]